MHVPVITVPVAEHATTEHCAVPRSTPAASHENRTVRFVPFVYRQQQTPPVTVPSVRVYVPFGTPGVLDPEIVAVTVSGILLAHDPAVQHCRKLLELAGLPELGNELPELARLELPELPELNDELPELARLELLELLDPAGHWQSQSPRRPIVRRSDQTA